MKSPAEDLPPVGQLAPATTPSVPSKEGVSYTTGVISISPAIRSLPSVEPAPNLPEFPVYQFELGNVDIRNPKWSGRLIRPGTSSLGFTYVQTIL